MYNIFDTHAHYSESDFDSDREELLSEFPERGVKYVMLASSSLSETKANSEISQKYGYIYSAAGIHPENADSVEENYREILIETIKSNPKVKAVGEIGLDYHYEGYNRDNQIRLFREQLELAKELDMPVIIHSRDATKDTLDILREYRPKAVVHCFSGSAETAEELVKMGMYIGFTGVLTFKNAKKALKALEAVPLDRLLLETDCPYMAPVPFRGKRCDSTMIRYTAEKAAEIKETDIQEILNITCENGKRFYRIEN